LGRNRIVQFADVMAKALSSRATGPHEGRHAKTVPENKQPLVLEAAVGVAKNVARNPPILINTVSVEGLYQRKRRFRVLIF
jgi:hypothetical protein